MTDISSYCHEVALNFIYYFMICRAACGETLSNKAAYLKRS